MKAIGFIETSSVARGLVCCDAMLKAAPVELVYARQTCPGRYTVLVTGDVGAVQASVAAGEAEAQGTLIDSTLIPNVDERVMAAVGGVGEIAAGDAVGIVETYSLASGFAAADAAVKAAAVTAVELRLGGGMSGKAYILVSGSLSSVQAAVAAGKAAVEQSGMLDQVAVIPSPAPELRAVI
ncbi:MAG: BMC domain-containing protein [Thermoleophilia bacterium]